MKIVADADVDRPIIARPRDDGHEVTSIAELGPRIPDGDVVEIADREQAVLLTADKGFGDLVVRCRLLSTGAVLIRLAGISQELKAELVSAAIRDHAVELPGSFTVIEPGSVRVRRLRLL